MSHLAQSAVWVLPKHERRQHLTQGRLAAAAAATRSCFETQRVRTFSRLLILLTDSIPHDLRLPVTVHHEHQILAAGRGWQSQQPPASCVLPGTQTPEGTGSGGHPSRVHRLGPRGLQPGLRIQTFPSARSARGRSLSWNRSGEAERNCTVMAGHP